MDGATELQRWQIVACINRNVKQLLLLRDQAALPLLLLTLIPNPVQSKEVLPSLSLEEILESRLMTSMPAVSEWERFLVHLSKKAMLLDERFNAEPLTESYQLEH